MNKFNLPDIPDLTAVPSDELNERTLTAMHAAEPRKTAKKSRCGSGSPSVRRCSARLWC